MAEIEMWPVIWPEEFEATSYNPEQIALAKSYAATALRFLTLYRVGNIPITVMPCGNMCRRPHFSTFHPVLMESGAIQNCWCESRCTCRSVAGVKLDAPVARIEEVTLDGEPIPATEYHVEDGNVLVRKEGSWPSCGGENFTVTYLNTYPVDLMGKYVGGLLAWEFLKSVTGDKRCKLPSSITSLSRQGVQMEFGTGMFADGLTGITDVDSYTLQWNPHGLRTKPAIYSPDKRRQRQITWSA